MEAVGCFVGSASAHVVTEGPMQIMILSIGACQEEMGME